MQGVVAFPGLTIADVRAGLPWNAPFLDRVSEGLAPACARDRVGPPASWQSSPGSSKRSSPTSSCAPPAHSNQGPRRMMGARPGVPNALTYQEHRCHLIRTLLAPLVHAPVSPAGQPRIFTMTQQSHTKAAEQHENAAKSHRQAAEQHGKNDHSKGQQHAGEAQKFSKTARDASETAYGKSQQQQK